MILKSNNVSFMGRCKTERDSIWYPNGEHPMDGHILGIKNTSVGVRQSKIYDWVIIKGQPLGDPFGSSSGDNP